MPTADDVLLFTLTASVTEAMEMLLSVYDWPDVPSWACGGKVCR
jgi:hypothetical protein